MNRAHSLSVEPADYSETPSGNAPATVLFVDDEPQVLEGLKNIFRRRPYRILTAPSAKQGLTHLAQEPVDIVVSDERMPGTSGSEFLELLHQAYPDTIRIILTGQASLEAAVRAINKGEVYRFLRKPFHPTELTQVIHDAFRRSKRFKDQCMGVGGIGRQQILTKQLEMKYPGITEVDRTDTGSIVLEAMNEDLDALLTQMAIETTDDLNGPTRGHEW